MLLVFAEHCKNTVAMIRRIILMLLYAGTAYCIATVEILPEQDEYLRRTVVNFLNEEANHCSDMYGYSCSSKHLFQTPNIENGHWYTMKEAKKLLSSNDTYDYPSVAVEQELYQQCLDYGYEKGESLREIREKVQFFNELLSETIDNNTKWQHSNHKIARLGFGNAFFNIKVIRDPRNSRKKIIMLEPPSLKSLQNLQSVLESIDRIINTESWDDETSIVSFFNKLKDGPINSTKSFVNSLIKIIADTSSLDRKNILSERTTIDEWNRNYARKCKIHRRTTAINWAEIIYHEFYKVKINLHGSEPLIVKNVHYFTKLFHLLYESRNCVLGSAVVSKAISDNLRYMDFKFSLYFPNQDRIHDCLKETKLYGISQKILFDLSNDVINKKQTRKIQEIVFNIFDELKSAIRNAPQFSFAEESYLLVQLQDIITHLRFLDELQIMATNGRLGTWSPKSLPEFYDAFERSNSYLNNIRNYRQMLKLKELRSLKSPSDTIDHSPFSLTDLHVPANRFILNVFYNRVYFDNNYYKEQVFGVYGANIATLMYGLLNENKAQDDSYYSYDLKAHPNFIVDDTSCMDLDDSSSKGSDANITIASSVGLDIAFNAMNRIVSNQKQMPYIPYNQLHFKSIQKADQIFFAVNGMNHCDLDEAILNDIFSHSIKFSERLYCPSQCKYRAFRNLDKNLFLIKM